MISLFEDKSRRMQIAANGVAIAFWLIGGGSFGWGKNPYAQFVCLTSGLGFSLIGSWHGQKADRKQPYLQIQESANQKIFAQSCAKQILSLQDQDSEVAIALPPATTSAPKFYEWSNAVDDACGLIIAGQAGFGKSSSALFFLGLFTQEKPAHIKVLDPHGRINHWHEHGLEVVFDFDAIESELESAISELDRRRHLTENELKKEPAYIYVCDEVSACLDSFEKPKLVSKALRRLGCEGRKYGVSLIAIAHSHNADALGIDAKQRSNYLLVLLGDSARQVAETSWKKDSPEYQFIAEQAYPCMVSGSVRDMPAIHPTHGHHQHYKKVGNAPKSLLPIHQISANNKPVQPDNSEQSIMRQYLDRIYQLPDYTPAPNPTHFAPESAPAAPGDAPSAPIDIPESQPLPAPVQKGFSEVAKEGYPAAILPAPALAPMIESLKSEGLNQAQIIKTLWGISKGGNDIYRQAVQEFKEISKP